MIEMITEPSSAAPNHLNVVIVGQTEYEVQREMLRLNLQTFIPPVRGAHGKWCTMGRIKSDDLKENKSHA